MSPENSVRNFHVALSSAMAKNHTEHSEFLGKKLKKLRT